MRSRSRTRRRRPTRSWRRRPPTSGGPSSSAIRAPHTRSSVTRPSPVSAARKPSTADHPLSATQAQGSLRRAFVETPSGWSSIAARGPRGFVTRVTYRQAGGATVEWESRRHRKQSAPTDPSRGTTWWAPSATAWWIGVLFMVGSACFAVGSMPGYLDAVGGFADGVTYFVGSIFFTSAALLQYLEVVNTSRSADGAPNSRRRYFTPEPHRIDWWAGAVQLVGTLFFNASTFFALASNANTAQIDRYVWRPDALGSICFLVASQLAFAEVGHAWISWRPRLLSWWITALNLTGSIAFGVSAVAAYV